MLEEEGKNETFLVFLSVGLQLGFLHLNHPYLVGLLVCPLVL